MKSLFTWLFCLLLLATSAMAAGKGFVPPTPKDKCPVCGMFAAKFPDFLAEIVYKDGTYEVFDGPKDLFKHYLKILAGTVKGRKAAAIDSIYVTDYYGLQPADGQSTWYVVGSDVLGPMGKELIPFATETEAREFMKDHRGKEVLRFEEVTAATLKELD